MTNHTEKINYALSLVEGATPGPWAWEVNLEGKTVKLQGGRPRLDLTVMGFTRFGMSGAAPTFLIEGQGPGLQAWERADHYATPFPGREHHAHWFQRIAHPDAHQIALSPLIPAALRLALADVRYLTLRHAVIPQSVEHTTRHRKLTDEAWREAKDALDAFLSLLPEPMTKED